MSPKRHTSQSAHKRRMKRLPSRIAGGGILLLALGSTALMMQELSANTLLSKSPEQARITLARGMPAFATSHHYEAIASKALTLTPPDYALAEAASIKLLKQEPSNVAGWNRLAFIDIAEDGELSRAGITYLEKSYLLAPYGDLALMTWRTDFASQIWPSLPDDLQQKTLRQIPVIAKHGTSWEWRIRHCRENPNAQIAEIICAYTPGVVRPKN